MLSFAAFTLIFPALPQEEAPSFLYAQVGEHAATVRSFCHSETPVLTDLLPDTPIRVVAQRQPWSRIQVPGGFEVWVYGEFVDREGDVGTLNATHVRARPLPATSAKSYPVGQFLKGDRVYILEEKEKWLRVRAPENLGAWVLSESIVLLDKAPANWDALWLEAMPEDAVSGMELVKDTPEEILVEDVPTEVVEKTPTEDIGLVKVDIAETSPEATATEVVSAEMDETIEEPKEPKSLDQLDEAEAGLTELSAMGWNSNLAGKIESILGAVLWTSDESATLERAQAGLDRLERLRMLSTGDASSVSQFHALEASATRGIDGLASSYSLVGKMEFLPELYSAVPFTIATGDTKDSVLSRDGRFNLRDYVGREVAVRGIWRKSSLKGHRVLEIENLRVLPPILDQPLLIPEKKSKKKSTWGSNKPW